MIFGHQCVDVTMSPMGMTVRQFTTVELLLGQKASAVEAEVIVR